MKDISTKNTPIIIGGSHRSGTTLLRRILNGSKQIYCPPEVKLFKDLLGQFPNDPLAFARLGKSIQALGLPLDIWLTEFTWAYIKCMDLATEHAGKQRWADKNPENALNIGHWHRALNGNLQFIMVIRNPLDILASIKESGMKGAIPSDFKGRVHHVKEYIEAGLLYCAAHPEASYIVRYEDIVLSPHSTMEQLFFWLQADWGEESLTMLNDEKHGIGLEDPKAMNYKHVHLCSVDRWREDLLPDEQQTAVPKFWSTLERFNYCVGS